jgi:hypothetical protein
MKIKMTKLKRSVSAGRDGFCHQGRSNRTARVGLKKAERFVGGGPGGVPHGTPWNTGRNIHISC